MRKLSLMQHFCCDSTWDLDGSSIYRDLTEWAQLQLLCISLITSGIKICRIAFCKSWFSGEDKEKAGEKESPVQENARKQVKSQNIMLTSVFVLFIFINILQIKHEIHVKADNHSIHPQQAIFFSLSVANLWFKNTMKGWHAAFNGERVSYEMKQHCTRY